MQSTQKPTVLQCYYNTNLEKTSTSEIRIIRRKKKHKNKSRCLNDRTSFNVASNTSNKGKIESKTLNKDQLSSWLLKALQRPSKTQSGHEMHNVGNICEPIGELCNGDSNIQNVGRFNARHWQGMYHTSKPPREPIAEVKRCIFGDIGWHVPMNRVSGWWFGTFFTFPYLGNNNPNWLSYFSEGWLNHQPGFLINGPGTPWAKDLKDVIDEFCDVRAEGPRFYAASVPLARTDDGRRTPKF